MGKTENRFSEGLAWLRFVLNPTDDMPTVNDWVALYKFADKQKTREYAIRRNMM